MLEVMLYFQLMPAWKSSSFLGRSIIMNKKSQFTKIFFKAILDLKDSGTWDIMNGGKSRQMDQSYNLPDPREKAFGILGYKKLAILFAVLGLGTFMSLFVSFLEFITKMYFKKQNSTVTIHEQNLVKDMIELPREKFKWNINLLDSSFRRRKSI